MNALVVLVPLKPVNPLNARESHFTRYRRGQREREALAAALLLELRTRGVSITAKPEAPKRVTFTVHAKRLYDEGDNLASVAKHLRDELISLGLIHADGPDSGHVFRYAQRVAKPTGVEIRVELTDERSTP